MKYEFRVWNKADKMPELAPQAEGGRLSAIKSAIEGNNHGNPDIFIDTNELGEGVISSAKISYVVEKVKIGNNEVPHRFIKMSIAGSLYLPPDTTLEKAAASMVGKKGVENEKKDTLLLSKWVETPPNALANAEQPYYRAVILSVLTKAGDFRLISANNMYVESYSENYSEGEMGTFKLELQQLNDATSKFKVDGLEKEEVSALDKVKGAVAGTAKVAAAVAVAATVAKATTETVEKFTGETKWTRYAKGIADSSSNAANLTKNVTGFDKKNWDQSLKDIGKSGSDLVKQSKVTDNMRNDDEVKNDKTGIVDYKTLTIAELEAQYLSWIKADPKEYTKYRNASAAEKREMLLKAAQDKLARSKVTKRYEESQIDMDKVKDYESGNTTPKNEPPENGIDESKPIGGPPPINAAAGTQNSTTGGLGSMIDNAARNQNNGNDK